MKPRNTDWDPQLGLTGVNWQTLDPMGSEDVGNSSEDELTVIICLDDDKIQLRWPLGATLPFLESAPGKWTLAQIRKAQEHFDQGYTAMGIDCLKHAQEQC